MSEFIFTFGDLSFEVFADDQKSMIKQGEEINTWGKNVYVKVPVVNSKNKFSGSIALLRFCRVNSLYFSNPTPKAGLLFEILRAYSQ